VNARLILREVIEHQRFQAEKTAAAGIAIEVETQAGLVGAARAAAARPDADVADGLPVPREVGRVIGVGLEFRLQFGPVGGVDEQVNALDCLLGKQILRGLALGRNGTGQKREYSEYPDSCSAFHVRHTI
jgi:hypothetical protein